MWKVGVFVILSVKGFGGLMAKSGNFVLRGEILHFVQDDTG